MNKKVKDKLEENFIFVGTIYDSFEALEEVLGKLKLERPLFITHIAKLAFAEEVFKRAEKDPYYQINPQKLHEKQKQYNNLYN